MAKFRPPDFVVKKVEEYKRHGERYEIFPCRIIVNGKVYYSASYLSKEPLTGYIVMREDVRYQLLRKLN